MPIHGPTESASSQDANGEHAHSLLRSTLSELSKVLEWKARWHSRAR